MLNKYLFISFCFVFIFIFNGCEEKTHVRKYVQPVFSIIDSLSGIELGNQLFFDTRLSSSKTISCASCHIPRNAFATNDRFAKGVEGRTVGLNSPSILNLEDDSIFMHDGAMSSLQFQLLAPLLDSNEMNADLRAIIPFLMQDENYAELTQAAFGQELDLKVITEAIVLFEKTLVNRNSSFDKWKGGVGELSESAQAGYRLFTDKLKCNRCHADQDFSSNQLFSNIVIPTDSSLVGRYRVSGDSTDLYKYKVPSLRNVALTYPYFRDGRLSTLEQVIDFYQSNNFLLDEKIQITLKDKEDLISFLKSLNGSSTDF